MSEEWLCQPLRLLWQCGHGGRTAGAKLYTNGIVFESGLARGGNKFYCACKYTMACAASANSLGRSTHGR
jgi:hypothetical protein